MSTFHVSMMGNDGGSGSARDPFATLNRAVEATRPLEAGQSGVSWCAGGITAT